MPINKKTEMDSKKYGKLCILIRARVSIHSFRNKMVKKEYMKKVFMKLTIVRSNIRMDKKNINNVRYINISVAIHKVYNLTFVLSRIQCLFL